MYRNFEFLFIILIYFLSGINCQANTTNETVTKDYDNYVTEDFITYEKDALYCLRFTWLGPLYDNTSQVNGTCNDLAEEKKLKNTPCKQPLVITYDGSPPNLTYMWQNHRDNILCRAAKGQSCIKYSYTFNNDLQNLTYMCAKAISEGEGPIKKSVCYSQSINGYVVKSCICQPKKNSYYPCFYSGAQQAWKPILTVLASIVLVQPLVFRWWYQY